MSEAARLSVNCLPFVRLQSVATVMLLSIPAAHGEMHFTNVTAAANILHTHSHAPGTTFENPEFGRMTGGAVAEDFDGDGWTDLYVLQGGEFPNLLYMNQGDGTFANQAATRGAALTGNHVGACAADYDNDGDIDIFISSATAPHLLLVNDGGGYFTVDPQMFTTPATFATSPSWGDIDNDGKLDLALGAWKNGGLGDLKILRNTGAGQLQLHQSLPKNWTYTPRFADLDGDRFQDMMAIADFGQTSWYHNPGNGLLLPAGTSNVSNGMGGAIGDIDNDGDLDVFITSIDFGLTFGGNRLHLNNGSGGFSEISTAAGVRHGHWGWGAAFADFDNDGDLDLYQVNGTPSEHSSTILLFNNKPAQLFENLGGNTFQEIAAASGDAGYRGQGRCVVVFDYDNDGDQDMFVTNNSVTDLSGPTPVHHPGPPILFRNDTVNANHWLSIRLAGTAAPHHRHGIGSRVYTTVGTVTQMRELNASSGYLGHGPERIARFGLGTATEADVVRAVWTNGDETEIRNVTPDRELTLSSPQASLSQRTVDPGESFTAEIAAASLPPGATAEWSVNGQTYGNPATITLYAAGTYQVRVTLSDGTALLRTETLIVTVRAPDLGGKNVARLWNEENLAAIRVDTPKPTVHARNLFHTSVGMWDAWAAYDSQALGVLHHEKASAADIEAARNEAISYAAFRILSARYAGSVNASTTLAFLNLRLAGLGYDPAITTVIGNSPAALGNRVAQTVLGYASNDGASNPASFMGGSYAPVNSPLPVDESGTVMNFPNLWQPLLFKMATTQNGQTADLIQSFIGSNWGAVRPFALASLAGGHLHLDPGPPPALGGDTDQLFKQGAVDVIAASSQMDPADGELIDISPAARGNSTLGTNNGSGRPLNPATGQPYPPNLVKRADFARVLAEYWADGPSSETPPGHWNSLANKVSDSPGFLRKIGGGGPTLDPLEWDVKLYLALNGAVHDAAICAWGCKRVYNSSRPISAIRHMGGRGQSSDPGGPSYDPQGLPLVAGSVELITASSTAPGERHAHLADHPGEIAIRAWTAKILPAGVHWIRAVDWLPYQKDTFVTPAFPGFVSGHSTFSRAAAEVMVRFTGSEYFPGGLSTFTASRNVFLKTDTGPSDDIVLQWATYYDAADQAGLSRIYGGIHVPADDGPGRVIGSQCGILSWNLALKYYDGSIASEPFSARLQNDSSGGFQLDWNATRGAFYQVQTSDDLTSGFTDHGEVIWAGESREAILLPAPQPGVTQKFFRVRRVVGEP
jgi:hypothetical protein